MPVLNQVKRVTLLNIELLKLSDSNVVQDDSTTKGCHPGQFAEVCTSFNIQWMSASPRNTFEVVAYLPVWTMVDLISFNPKLHIKEDPISSSRLPRVTLEIHVIGSFRLSVVHHSSLCNKHHGISIPVS
jgi:hypothetical protein